MNRNHGEMRLLEQVMWFSFQSVVSVLTFGHLEQLLSNLLCVRLGCLQLAAEELAPLTDLSQRYLCLQGANGKLCLQVVEMVHFSISLHLHLSNLLLFCHFLHFTILI